MDDTKFGYVSDITCKSRISLVGIASRDYKHICIAYTSDDSCIDCAMQPLSIDSATDFH